MSDPPAGPPELVHVSLVVWLAETPVEPTGSVFKEEMSVLNSTHMVALLESRLQRRHNVNMSVGAVEYYDDDVRRWMPLVAEHDLQRFAQPIKLRVWSRKRSFSCLLHPLHDNSLPRRVTVRASDMKGFRSELSQWLLPEEQNFRIVLLCDPATSVWAPLTDLAAVPQGVEELNLKLDVVTAPLVPTSLPTGIDPSAELRQLLNTERGRVWTPTQAEAPESLQPPRTSFRSVPTVSRQYGSVTVDMPVRLPTEPLQHTFAEIRGLHNSDIPSDPAAAERRRAVEEPNRDRCCYPGSGLVHSVDSSRHGELKRQVIAYVRALLQDPDSPVQEYLPRGGLPTADLVNLTALAAHYFMIRCPVRPDTSLTVEDRSELHSILAHCIAEHPIARDRDDGVPEEVLAGRQRQRQQDKQLASSNDYPAAPLFREEVVGSEGPQVVLMQPQVAVDGSVIVYGTVTCADGVECKWLLRSQGDTIPIDDIFDSGLATTQPISSSCFALTLLPGSLARGRLYSLSLRATAEATGKRGSAVQDFRLPT